eukprot:244075_1
MGELTRELSRYLKLNDSARVKKVRQDHNVFAALLGNNDTRLMEWTNLHEITVDMKYMSKGVKWIKDLLQRKTSWRAQMIHKIVKELQNKVDFVQAMGEVCSDISNQFEIKIDFTGGAASNIGLAVFGICPTKDGKAKFFYVSYFESWQFSKGMNKAAASDKVVYNYVLHELSKKLGVVVELSVEEKKDEQDEKQFEAKCQYLREAKSIFKQEFPNVPSDFFDTKNDICFCEACHKARKDKIVYSRGDPSKRYGLPIGWCRLGLDTPVGFCKLNEVWKKWHVGFHGTTKETVPLIFKGRLILLKAGDVALGGAKLGIRDGHIPKPFKRNNLYTKKEEVFDPNQIFLSQSIKYSGGEVYAKFSECNHPKQKDKKIKVKFAFQVRIRPGSYQVGQETIGATKKKQIIDENFDNNELEWYTKENVGIVVYGLLMKFN